MTQDGDEYVPVAVKEIKQLEIQSYEIEREWRREADAMRAFNHLANSHIIRGVSAVKQSEKYFIILEWANGGNLRNYWKSNPKPTLDAAITLEFLEQLRGITGALYEIHEYTKVSSERARTLTLGMSTSSDERPHEVDKSSVFTAEDEVIEESDRSITSEQHENSLRTLSPQHILPNPQLNISEDFEGPMRSMAGQETTMTGIPVPQVTLQRPPSSAGDASIIEDTDDVSHPGDNWRLGDVKPDNILRFENGEWLGCLKLADFGRAKKHKDITQLRKVGTDEKYGTRKYEPPEAVTHTHGGKRSRLYDVWSMGCVIFESLYWLLYGIQEQDKLDSATKQSNLGGLDTAYWTLTSMNPPTATVNKITSDCIDYMLAKDPECNQQSGTALGDLLRLVKDKLLVVRLPEKNDTPEERKTSRATAEFLHVEIKKIISRCQNESAYLFTGTNREGIMPPPLAQQPQPALLPVGSGNDPSLPAESQTPGGLRVPESKQNVRSPPISLLQFNG